MKPDDQDQLRLADEINSAVTDARDGWWFRAVLDAFAFLGSDFGYRVTEVHQHFRGNYVRFDGATFALVIAYDPEDTGSTAAELWVTEDMAPGVEHPRAVSDVLRSRDPNLGLPDPGRLNLGKSEVLGAIATWASGLRALTPDVLRGAWPQGVSVMYLW